MPSRSLYLASASPRRRQLLSEARIPFALLRVDVDEDALSERYAGPLEQLGEYLARAKAEAGRIALLRTERDGVVLASDTTVLLDGRSLAKPRDAGEAITMLRALRGREHVVATGVATVDATNGAVFSATSATRVRMRDYGDDEIAAYVTTGDPLDKAGAYSIQHPHFSPVAALQGCHLGVIGLPICLVTLLLSRFGLAAPHLPDAAATPPCPWSATCRAPFPPAAGVHTERAYF